MRPPGKKKGESEGDKHADHLKYSTLPKAVGKTPACPADGMFGKRYVPRNSIAAFLNVREVTALVWVRPGSQMTCARPLS